MSKILSLKELTNEIANLSISGFDLPKCATDYEADPQKKRIRIFNLKYSKSIFKVALTGEVTTNGIAVNTWDGGASTYSIGLRFADSNDYENFEKVVDFLISNLNDSWDLTNSIKDEIIYLKLKPSNDKKSFGVKSNIKLDPKKPNECAITQGQGVTVVVELGVYLNMEDSKAGLTIKPISFCFDE